MILTLTAGGRGGRNVTQTSHDFEETSKSVSSPAGGLGEAPPIVCMVPEPNLK